MVTILLYNFRGESLLVLCHQVQQLHCRLEKYQLYLEQLRFESQREKCLIMYDISKECSKCCVFPKEPLSVNYLGMLGGALLGRLGA